MLVDALKAFDDGKRGSGDDQHVPFTVVADGMNVGQVTLWGIDAHNRRAHLGIGLGLEHRCKGYGSDANGWVQEVYGGGASRRTALNAP